ncbi:hypothetical protein D5125_01230 [Magnetovirga frankeli]|uniref:hypothetical protein n=1 Tax=Magnetovirga frankeli TaxID=947516 RepID=UPI00129303E1|nr:hypothetical protein D5125_01230 [gamma proteobacterium SS-5]
MRQPSGILGVSVLFALLLVGGGFLRYQQVAQVSDPAIYQMLRQRLSTDLLEGGIKSLSHSLGQGDLGAVADQALRLARKRLLVIQVRAARPLYDFAPFGETRFAVDYRIEGQDPAQATTAYLRYLNSPDQGWRYLGSTSAEGFYSFYLARELIPNPK